MLNEHLPTSIEFRDLRVTSLATNRTSLVHFTKYNEKGYQFTAATHRDYWLQWESPFRVDPTTARFHKMDLMNDTDGWIHMVSGSCCWFRKFPCVCVLLVQQQCRLQNVTLHSANASDHCRANSLS